MTFEERSREYREFTEEYLKNIYSQFRSEPQSELFDAMEYSLLAGGKRLRPIFVLDFCRMCGGDWHKAAPFAAAMEMIHTYSLIHDDLPCMDNDELRRGKPTNHMVYGEDIALLAGDALMTRGYEIAANNADVDANIALTATRKLLFASGAVGMMGGQQIDLKSENVQIDFDTLLKMHAKKTGALIRVSAELGCLAAGITDENDARMKAACDYANGIGLAFQIKDDILDVTGSLEKLGKMAGSDVENGKTTYVTLLGVEKCQHLVDELTEEALNELDSFQNNEALNEYAEYLAKRDY